MEPIARVDAISHQLDALQREIAALRESLVDSKAETAPPESRQEGDVAAAILSFLALRPTMEHDDLLRTILQCAMAVTAAQGAGLTLFDSKRGRLVFRAALGVGADDVLGYEVPLEGSQHGLAFATGEIQAGKPIHREIDEVAGTSFSSVMVAPLMAEDEPVGTMSLVNKQGDGTFTAADMETCDVFSRLAALVVRQRLRESAFLQVLRGTGELPEELASLAFGNREQQLMNLVERLVRIADVRESLLPKLDLVISAFESFTQSADYRAVKGS